MKDFLKNKSYGFYVTLGLLVLTVVTTIVYAVSYSNYERYMSWGSVVSMLVGTVVSILLILLKQNQLSVVSVALGDFIALLLFIVRIYNYVAVVMVGIDLSTFSSEFIVCTTLFVILLVGGIIDIFLKQTEEER